MKQLLLDNSTYNYRYNAKGFKEYQNIISYILSKIAEQSEHPNPAMSILKKGGSKRRIVRQLRNMYENDK
jgi:hypothetical protein